MTECIGDYADGIYLLDPGRLAVYSLDTAEEWLLIEDIQGDIGGVPSDFAFSSGYDRIYIKRHDGVIFEYSLVLTTTTITVTLLGESLATPNFGYDVQPDGLVYGVAVDGARYSIGGSIAMGFPAVSLVYFASYPWNPTGAGEDPSSVAGKVIYPGFDEWSSIRSELHPGRMYFLSSLVTDPPPPVYPQGILQNTVPPGNPSTFLFTIESPKLKAHGYKVPCGVPTGISAHRLLRFSAPGVLQWADMSL